MTGPDPIPTFPDERLTAALLVLQCGTMRPKVHPQLEKLNAYLRPSAGADNSHRANSEACVQPLSCPESRTSHAWGDM